YALKYFFTGEVAGGTRDSILKRIRSLIDGEDPAKPLSDQKIADMLSSEGIEISRRTVAKYRDEAGILPTSARRKRI
ncbi:MAG: RNA polymerase sigma-54 factor, partial [Mogibacterium sp.]|nr:RNA polymerase sigma-54 factor [Mogibacterium sp.]